MNETSTAFEGFPSPTEHYFSLPNEWINICAQITSLAELKVILYVARHTWGYHEYDLAKALTLDEFVQGRKRKDGSRMDAGTGLSRQSVVDGLQRAMADGYLLCEIDQSDMGRIRKCYLLKMREAQTSDLVPMVKELDASSQESSPQGSTIQTVVNNVDLSSQESRPQQSRIQTPGAREVDFSSQESRPRSEKNTEETHQEKHTRERHSQKNRRNAQAMSAPSLSEQARGIYDAWCTLFTVEVPLTASIAQAAQDLVQPVARWSQELDITRAELLKRMMHWLYETDKTGYYRRGVKLYDLAREFEAWQSATERQRRQKSGQRPVPSLQENPYSIAALIASQNPGYFAARNGDES